ncbi:MAG: hypothetical protein V4772_00270 [Pseudomonadota bacterium]
MTRLHAPTFSLVSACLAAAGLLSACGGDSSAPAAPVVATTTVSGTVVKGPVTGAKVCAYKAVAAGKGEEIKCATTAAGGLYSMDLQYEGDVVIEATGGTYTDEATNTTKTLSEPLQVVVASKGGSTTGMVTPLTSVAYSISKGLTGGVNSNNFTAAGNTVATQFKLGTGVNIATLAPTLGEAANAYGKALQALSRFVANGGNLGSFLTWTNPSSFQGVYSSAYAAANGVTLTFDFNPATGTGTTVVTGTGAGGGSATCAVNVSGTIATAGVSVPLNVKYCIRGLQSAAECTSGNASISQSLSGASGLAGAVNLNYSYSNDCSGALVTIDLK